MCVCKPANTEKSKSGCFIASVCPYRWVYMYRWAWHHKPAEAVSKQICYLNSKEKTITFFLNNSNTCSGADNIWGKDSESINLRTTSSVQEQASTQGAVFAYADICILCKWTLFFPRRTNTNQIKWFMFPRKISKPIWDKWLGWLAVFCSESLV